MSKALSRRWHNRLSIVFILPLFLVGMTAIFLAHGKSLGLRQIPVPGMSLVREPELRGLLADGDSWLLGTKAGLFRQSGPRLQPVAGMEGVEVRRLLAVGKQRFVAAKQGLFREQDGQWRSVLAGDAWDLSESGGRLLAVLAGNALMQSLDGGSHWEAAAEAGGLNTALVAQRVATPMMLSQLVMGLHTGEIFLGHDEWLWIDAVGGLMVFLSLTGIWMWWRERQRRQVLP